MPTMADLDARFAAISKMDDWYRAPRGGADMPPKTDMHDVTTPSGQMPLFITPAFWDALKADGYDMRWYAVSRPLPTTKKPAASTQGHGGLNVQRRAP